MLRLIVGALVLYSVVMARPIVSRSRSLSSSFIPLPLIRESALRNSSFLHATPYGTILGSCASKLPLIRDPQDARIPANSNPETCARRYLGIPFARPPLNQLRFRPPVPWTASWNAPVTTLKSSSPKSTSSNLVLDGRRFRKPCMSWILPMGMSSEDCLYLNVFTPPPQRMANQSRPLPVIFWIFGGGFAFGDAEFFGLQDPSFLVTMKDVIVVNFNYRVSLFGFYQTLNASSTSGNYGYLDQKLALEWVKTHIHLFGGDPDRISVWGESIGASSVAQLMVDLKAPTFQSAAMFSSPFALFPMSDERNREIGSDIARRVHCWPHGRPGNATLSADEGEKVADCMRSVSAEHLIDVSSFGLRLNSKEKRHSFGDSLYYQTTLDGVHILGRPLDILVNPSAELQKRLSTISVLLGSTRDEFELFLEPATLAKLWPDSVFISVFAGLNNVTVTEYASEFRPTHHEPDELTISQSGNSEETPNEIGTNATANKNLYIQSVGQLFNNNTKIVSRILELYPASDSALENRNQFSRMATDYCFTCSARRFALLANGISPAIFLYEFRQRSDLIAPLLGTNRSALPMNFVPHTIDVPYIFHSTIPVLHTKWKRRDDITSRFMVDQYVAFAMDPMAEGERRFDSPNALQLNNMTHYPHWERFHPDTQFYMEVDSDPALLDHNRANVCDMWDNLTPVNEESVRSFDSNTVQYPHVPYTF